MGPELSAWCLTRAHRHREGQGRVKVEAAMGELHPEVQVPQSLLGALRDQERAWHTLSRMNQPGQHLDFSPVMLISDLRSPDLWEKKCLLF